MNALQLLKSKLSAPTSSKKSINWVEIDIPYNLKDACKVLFKGQIKYDGDEECWLADEEIVDNFSKVFLEEYIDTTKDQRQVLKKMGCNFDKVSKLWYMLKYQTEQTHEDNI